MFKLRTDHKYLETNILQLKKYKITHEKSDNYKNIPDNTKVITQRVNCYSLRKEYIDFYQNHLFLLHQYYI